MVLDRFGLGQFWISGQNRFNFFSCRFGSGFGSFGSGQLDRVTFARSTLLALFSFACPATFSFYFNFSLMFLISPNLPPFHNHDQHTIILLPLSSLPHALLFFFIFASHSFSLRYSHNVASACYF